MGAAEDVVGMERGDRKGTGDKEVTEVVQEEDEGGEHQPAKPEDRDDSNGEHGQ